MGNHARPPLCLPAAVAAHDANHYVSQIAELSQLVRFYEAKVTSLAANGAGQGGQAQPGEAGVGGGGGGTGGGGSGLDSWVLEDLVHKNEAFLLDRKTGKVFSVPGQDSYPRPMGECASR